MIRKTILLLFALVGFAGTMNAQNHITLDEYDEEDVKASGSITLLPGFEVTEGNEFRAHIVPAPAISVELQTAPTSNRNYIISYGVQKSGITDPTDVDNLTTEVNPVIQYLDGLGRPEQTVQVKGSPGGRDIVQHIEYDPFGREVKKYLPYSASAASSNGSFKSSAAADQGAFYDDPEAVNAPGVVATAYPYAMSVLESSPLSRLQQQGAPGAAWQPYSGGIGGSGHTVKMVDSLNATADSVRLWKVWSSTTASGKTNYSNGTLYKKTVKDENWSAGKAGTSEEFKDKDGRVVLKRVWKSSTVKLSTYYVYDNAGNLRYVIPPGTTTDTLNEGNSTFSQYMYAYHYDSHRRVFEKKIPGKGWEELLYNKHDQVVMTRDTLLKKRGRWLFTKYDALGRMALTGITDSISTSRSSWQSTLDAQSSATFVSRDNSNGSSTGTGYTDAAYPAHTDVEQYHTMTYYDDYKFYGGSNYSYAGSRMIRGLPTGTKINVLGTNDFLFTKNYYDDKGRAVKIFSQHYKEASIDTNKVDAITNTYDFTGAMETSKREHFVSSFPGGSPALTLFTKYEYDHTGRKRNTKMKINSGDTVLLSQADYNEIGQLSVKKLHSSVAAENFIQTTDYQYNERGWLTSINDPDNVTGNKVFGMELTYANHSDAYNGNIGSISWQTNVPGGLGLSQQLQGYDYTYDKLNRLTFADYAASGNNDKFNEEITYDPMGNIVTLKRKNNTSGYLHDFTYNYTNSGVTGNKLWGISDDTGTANHDSSYGYDDNGNMISDSKKSISIKYNILNLPNEVTKSSDHLYYTYDATGRKLRKVLGSDDRDYINGIEYFNGSIAFVQTEEGRATPGSPYLYEYALKDHLGNTRATVKGDGTIIQVQDYYAFGMEMNPGNSLTPSPDNKYRYNGKEMQGELSLNQYDYGARFYDPMKGRWDVIDPLAEKNFNISTYVYGINNPIKFIDKDGLYAVSVHYEITYRALKSLGYSDTKAREIAYYSSTYADHPTIAIQYWDAIFHPFIKTPSSWPGSDYGKTSESQNEKNSMWHAMMTDAEAKAGKTEQDAVSRGLSFGWDNIFDSDGGKDLGKLGQGLHALQDAVAHQGMRTSDHLGVNLSSVVQTIGIDLYGSTKKASNLTNSALIVVNLLQGNKVNIKSGDTLNVTGMSSKQLKTVLELLLKQGFQGNIKTEE